MNDIENIIQAYSLIYETLMPIGASRRAAMDSIEKLLNWGKAIPIKLLVQAAPLEFNEEDLRNNQKIRDAAREQLYIVFDDVIGNARRYGFKIVFDVETNPSKSGFLGKPPGITDEQ